jgi:hypothetical protein
MPGYSCFSLFAENGIPLQGSDMIDNTKFTDTEGRFRKASEINDK